MASLRFSSLADIRDAADKAVRDVPLSSALSKKKSLSSGVTTVTGSLLKLIEAFDAETKKAECDKETQYIFLRRIGGLFTSLNETDLFVNSPDYSKLRMNVPRRLEILPHLEKHLNELYESKRQAKSGRTSSHVLHSSLVTVDKTGRKSEQAPNNISYNEKRSSGGKQGLIWIEPSTLVELLRKNPSDVVILDLRSHTEFCTNHIKCEHISSLNPTVLSKNSPLSVSAVDQRLNNQGKEHSDAFRLRNNVNNIVFVDEDGDNNAISPEVETALKVLYDYSSVKPKKDVMLLAGGFYAFASAYQSFTTNPTSQAIYASSRGGRDSPLTSPSAKWSANSDGGGGNINYRINDKKTAHNEEWNPHASFDYPQLDFDERRDQLPTQRAVTGQTRGVPAGAPTYANSSTSTFTRTRQASPHLLTPRPSSSTAQQFRYLPNAPNLAPPAYGAVSSPGAEIRVDHNKVSIPIKHERRGHHRGSGDNDNDAAPSGAFHSTTAGGVFVPPPSNLKRYQSQPQLLDAVVNNEAFLDNNDSTTIHRQPNSTLHRNIPNSTDPGCKPPAIPSRHQKPMPSAPTVAVRREVNHMDIDDDDYDDDNINPHASSVRDMAQRGSSQPPVNSGHSRSKSHYDNNATAPRERQQSLDSDSKTGLHQQLRHSTSKPARNLANVQQQRRSIESDALLLHCFNVFRGIRNYEESSKFYSMQTAGGLVGLRNMGQTCFMASVLQCLSFCKPLRQYLIMGSPDDRRIPGMLFDIFVDQDAYVSIELSRMFLTMWKPENNIRNIKPEPLWVAINALSHGKFPLYRQHDAAEVFEFIVGQTSEECNTAIGIKNRDLKQIDIDKITDIYEKAEASWRMFEARERSVITSLFYGQMKSTVVCGSCQHESCSFEPLMHWQCQIPEDGRSQLHLNDCIKDFFRTEQLSEYKCDRCRRTGSALKKLDMWRLPDILVIHLKRFRQVGASNVFEKIGTTVKFELDGWDVAPFMSADAVIDGDRSTTRSKSSRYNLFGVVWHQGGYMSGHYISNVRNLWESDADTWYECNDEVVSEVAKSSVERKQAYLLFYARCG